jgi:hypothetical protein
MRFSKKVATVLIAVPLCALILSARYMVGFRQQLPPAGTTARPIEIWQHFVREAGYGRLVIGLLGLVILLVPFRRNHRWAWLALLIILLFYLAPVFVIRELIPFPGWHIFSDWLTGPGLARVVFFQCVLFPLLMALGLCLSFSAVFRGRR